MSLCILKPYISQELVYQLVNDRTGQNRVRPNPEASAKFTEASAESLAKNSKKKNAKFFKFYQKIWEHNSQKCTN